MRSRTRERIPLLSKSRFMAGLQCHKRLYLSCYHRLLADPVTAQQQALFDSGNKIGVLARELFPGGEFVYEGYLDHSAAVKSTESIMAAQQVPALYEAAFTYDGIRIRADILVRKRGNNFNLIEIKSGTKTKEEHIPDVAVQLYVLNGCGINIQHIYLGHLNSDYVYQGGDYEIDRLFSLDDVTREARSMQPEIPLLLSEMREHLWSMRSPDIDAGRQCLSPYTCEFYGHCHINEPEYHISQLPRASQELMDTLKQMGIKDIRFIPDDFAGLNPLQKRVWDCVVNNRKYVDRQLEIILKQLSYPIHFIDFETFSPPLPLYSGTKPYQVLPFQWSDHILEEDGAIRHEGFLYDGTDDPRGAFATSLLNVLGSKGSIVVYSGFEESRIKELAEVLPERAEQLLSLLEGRIVDLLQLIREYCYHPEFHGSFSIKNVLPALVPGKNYEDLDINDGAMASIAYAEMIRAETASERRNFLRRSLLEYCHRDTEAELQLFKTLLQIDNSKTLD